MESNICAPDGKAFFIRNRNWARRSKKMGRPLKVADWDTAIRSEELMRKILEVWGFPKPKKKGG